MNEVSQLRHTISISSTLDMCKIDRMMINNARKSGNLENELLFTALLRRNQKRLATIRLLITVDRLENELADLIAKSVTQNSII